MARRGLAWVVLALTALILLLRFVPFIAEAAVRPSHGFHAYYTASRLFTAGISATRFYDDDWFRAATERIQPGANDIYNANMPTTGLLLLPLAGFEYVPARVIWTAFSLLILIAALAALAWDLGLRGLKLLFVALGLLVFQPVYAQFAYGQAYSLMTALLVLAWFGWRYDRDGWFGGAVGLMLVLKSAGWPLILLMLLQRRWRALAWAVGWVAGVILLSLPQIGLDSWLTYLEYLRQSTARPALMSPAYQSVGSLFKQLFVYDATWNPDPLLIAPAVASVLFAGSMMLVIGSSTLATRRDNDGWMFAAFVVIGVVFSPTSLDYHYLMLLVPILILASDMMGCSGGVQALFLLALLLMGMWASPDDLARLHPLLAYPRLYGALILWGLIIAHRLPMPLKPNLNRIESTR